MSMKNVLLNNLGVPKGESYSYAIPISHYNDPIIDRETMGYSRKVGDVSEEVQIQVLDILIANALRVGLSENDIAYVVAIARHESGFNPDAAAGGNSTATGIGQFLDSTGKHYGLNDNNRWDVEAQAKALVNHYIDNKALLDPGQGLEYIYAYHHDGPSLRSGGLELSKSKIMPWLDEAKDYILYSLSHSISTINGIRTTEHTDFSNKVGDVVLGPIIDNSNLTKDISFHVDLETSNNEAGLVVTATGTDALSEQNQESLIRKVLDSLIEFLSGEKAEAAELSIDHAGNIEDLDIIVQDTHSHRFEKRVKIKDGVIDNDNLSPTFTLDDFEIDIDRFLEDGKDPRISFTISHDGDEDLSGVKVKFYATKNGKLDGDEIYLDYESAGTLRVDEQDNEYETVQKLADLTGEWQIVTTVQHDDIDKPIILRVDDVDLGSGQEMPEMLSVELENADAVSDDSDLRIEYVLHNPTDEDMRDFEVKFYASKSEKFDIDQAIYLDRESGGTLRDGEHDSEGETIQDAADLDAGDWNLFSVATWRGQDDGVVLSTNQFTVEADKSSNIDLIIEDFRLDSVIMKAGEDMYVRHTAANIGSEDARSTRTTYYWSEDDSFNFKDDIKLDTDSHGTLRAGEFDTNEYERIDYEDIPTGLGYVYGVIDAENKFDEGYVGEQNNISDGYAIYVYDFA